MKKMTESLPSCFQRRFLWSERVDRAHVGLPFFLSCSETIINESFVGGLYSLHGCANLNFFHNYLGNWLVSVLPATQARLDKTI